MLRYFSPNGPNPARLLAEQPTELLVTTNACTDSCVPGNSSSCHPLLPFARAGTALSEYVAGSAYVQIGRLVALHSIFYNKREAVLTFSRETHCGRNLTFVPSELCTIPCPDRSHCCACYCCATHDRAKPIRGRQLNTAEHILPNPPHCPSSC